jgi:hypothetical protein
MLSDFFGEVAPMIAVSVFLFELYREEPFGLRTINPHLKI